MRVFFFFFSFFVSLVGSFSARAQTALSEAELKAHLGAELIALADAKKIDGSWKGAALVAFEARTPAGEQYVATYENKKDKKNSELCLIVTKTGAMIAGGPALDAAGAMARAQEEVERLATQLKLAPSWIAVKAEKAEKKKAAVRWQWVVTLKNPQEPPERQTLFVFLKPYGDFITANDTGK